MAGMKCRQVCDQAKTVFVGGKNVKAKLEELVENGAEVIRIGEAEVEAISMAYKLNQKLPAMKLSAE